MPSTQTLYLLTWIIAGISILLSIVVELLFSHYNKIPNSLELSGADLIKLLNKKTGLSISAKPGRGWSADYFDPRTNSITLSNKIYSTPSIAAIGITAHEYGHALQKATKYPFLMLRSIMVPVVNIGTNLGTWIFFIGLILGLTNLAMLGVILFASVTVFTLITLPVEFNASFRALKLLKELNLPTEELNQVKIILFFAALTYVAAFASALINLLYMLSLLNDRK